MNAKLKPSRNAGDKDLPDEAGAQADAKVRRSELLTQAAFTSTLVVQAYINVQGTDANALFEALQAHAQAINAGDLTHVEAMLINQAISTQAMFTDLATRARNQTDLACMQALMKLALRAQGNSRATLQTLAEMKNPRQATFVSQANIAHGPQQVNNDVASAGATGRARGRKKRIAPNELLEEDHGQWLDTGATRAAGGADQDLEPVGEVHRTPKRPRQGKVGS